MKLTTRRERTLNISRFKPVTKTITLKLRVETTEFLVLADALAGMLVAAAIHFHGCKAARIIGCQVNGREVTWPKVSSAEAQGRAMRKMPMKELTCPKCGGSVRLNKSTDEFTCRKRDCGYKSVVSL